MATKKATTPAKRGTTEVADWEAQMAADAAIAAGQQRSAGGGGKFFSLKAGVLTYDGNAMPGNQMAVVVVGWTMENSFYDTAYDPDNKAAPKCFAFAQDEDDLEPHEAVDKEDYFERQNDVCNGCPQNEWGSARTGRGKACSNVVRLALLPAGTYKSKGGRNAGLDLEMIDDEEHYEKADLAYMKLSVMNVKGWTNFVKQAANELGRPPYALFTNLAVEPDPKSQFKIVFEVLDNVPAELMPIVHKRYKSAMDGIGFPYTPPIAEEQAERQPANSKLTQKKPAAKTAAKKR